jgi:HK97 family phage prohead protease
MSELLYRSYAPQLEVRTGANQDGRTIYGIAVPWNAPMRINDHLVEEFGPGAFDHQIRAGRGQLGAPVTRIVYAREHMPLGGTLIGRVSMMRNDAAGQYVEMRVAKTPVGDETLELVREGALPHLSVGFRERQDGNMRKAGGVVCRTKADMFEIASTLEGAYGDMASAVGVRGRRLLVARLDTRAAGRRAARARRRVPYRRTAGPAQRQRPNPRAASRPANLKSSSVLASGRFWMFVWLGIFAVVLIWGVVTALFLMDSTRNLNALSIAALIVACAAGVQTTLTMRKADPDDRL